MNFELRQVTIEEKPILLNLIEKYEYEFSQYSDLDVSPLGLFGYKYLDYYWVAANRWAYFLLADGKLAGFVMVNDFPECEEECDYAISEFFVLFKYRRCGAGRWMARRMFDSFHGRWQLEYHPKNVVSVKFWERVVNEYMGEGNYRVERAVPGTEYEDGSPGNIILFDNGNK